MNRFEWDDAKNRANYQEQAKKREKTIMTLSQERLRELQELQESDAETIDFSDIPELTDDFWQNATYRENTIDRLIKRAKSVKVTLSLSEESVDFFKQKARAANVSYQKLIRLAIDDYISELK